jgi:uncharacterized membrane protein
VIRALAILLVSALPARATVDGWPALHDVAGVAADDVLNVRAEPDAEAEIVGTLAHDATDIEVIRPNDDFTWGWVATGEGMGWVSLAYLERQPGQWDGQYPDFAFCSGTEPFWSLSRSEGRIAFEGLDLPASGAPVEFEESSLNHRGRHSFKAGGMIGVLSNVPCNDGMSELEYGWELNLIRLSGPEGQRHFMGCCSIRPREVSR